MTLLSAGLAVDMSLTDPDGAKEAFRLVSASPEKTVEWGNIILAWTECGKGP